MNVINLLKTFFGFDDFRAGQREVVEALVSDHDVLAIYPTGTGKSLCFQLAGLARGQLTVVISPLIALMKDQVAGLVKRQIAAEYLSSHLSPGQKKRILAKLALRQVSFLYLSPEKLQDTRLQQLIASQVNLVVVDEAHCISAWGKDFRPPYIKIGGWIATLPRRPPVAAFTATATQQVISDICTSLVLKNPQRFSSSLIRPNLNYVFAPCCTQVEQLELVQRWLRFFRGQDGIIYAGTREAVIQWTSYLSRFYSSVAAYHAGVPAQQRLNLQSQFIDKKIQILVATSAFGMGVDKPDVRWVLHVGLPADLESYLQEAGRGGRDGQTATAGVVISTETWQKFLEQFEQNFPEPMLVKSFGKFLYKNAQGTPFSLKDIPKELNEDLSFKKREYLLRLLKDWNWIHRKKDLVQWSSSAEFKIWHEYQKKYSAKLRQVLALEEMLTKPCCFTNLYLDYFEQPKLESSCQNCSYCQPELLLPFRNRTTLPKTQVLLPRMRLGLT